MIDKLKNKTIIFLSFQYDAQDFQGLYGINVYKLEEADNFKLNLNSSRIVQQEKFIKWCSSYFFTLNANCAATFRGSVMINRHK